MMTPFQRIRHRGIFYSIAMLIYRVLPVWVFRYTVMDVLELDLDRIQDLHFKHANRLRHLVSYDDREQLTKLTHVSTVECDQEYPLSFGLMDESGETLVGGLWIGEEVHREVSFGFDIQIPKQTGWLFAAMLDKRFRGQGLYNDLLVYSAKQSRQMGKRRILLAVSPLQQSAVHSHGKFSKPEKVGRLYALRIFGFAWLHCTGQLAASTSFTTRCATVPNQIQIGQTESPEHTEMSFSEDNASPKPSLLHA